MTDRLTIQHAADNIDAAHLSPEEQEIRIFCEECCNDSILTTAEQDWWKDGDDSYCRICKYNTVHNLEEK